MFFAFAAALLFLVSSEGAAAPIGKIEARAKVGFRSVPRQTNSTSPHEICREMKGSNMRTSHCLRQNRRRNLSRFTEGSLS